MGKKELNIILNRKDDDVVDISSVNINIKKSSEIYLQNKYIVV